MERWLSKSRVLLALSGLLLLSALNRHDPTIFGMFLFLATLSALGLLLPWLSLRSLYVVAAGTAEVVEGQASSLQLVVGQRSWLPAFMVEVQTHWTWGAKTIVLSHTLPLLRARQRTALGHQVKFPCRGDYRLAKVVLSSGFPLGLVTARRTMAQRGISVLVLPRAQPVYLPNGLRVSEDPLGSQVTPRPGQSYEPGSLRHYVAGEPMGRVNWRASARSGELVIQQFQQTGSPLLHLVMDIPPAQEVSQALAPTEQGLRIAIGICDAAAAAGVRVLAQVPQHEEPLRDAQAVRRALASATPGSLPLADAIQRVCDRLTDGAQLVAVASPRRHPADLVRELSVPGLGHCPVSVYIATHPSQAGGDLVLASRLRLALLEAGFQVVTDHASTSRPA